MTYFIGHCVYNNNNFYPFSVIPVDILSLSETNSSRNLRIDDITLQLFWQAYDRPRCGAPAIIKTSYIRLIQQKWRKYIKFRKNYYTPKFFKTREITGKK